jgi:hypothetical protein
VTSVARAAIHIRPSIRAVGSNRPVVGARRA